MVHVLIFGTLHMLLYAHNTPSLYPSEREHASFSDSSVDWILARTMSLWVSVDAPICIPRNGSDMHSSTNVLGVFFRAKADSALIQEKVKQIQAGPAKGLVQRSD